MTALPALGAAPWAEEPASFAGISIGKRFPAAGEIADCPLFEPFRRENLPDDLCVDTRKGVSADAIALKYVPIGGVTGDATVTLHDGLVQAIRVTFDARHFAYARTWLVERYGAFHSRVADEPGETLAWSGAHVALTVRQAGERSADHGRAVLELRAVAATVAR